ncbi:MAG: hypothetical protein ACK4FB_08155 [Brevundimonas sp.]|uniref:hypothetical protein n=1 Tax=Brevundimonas sp. TaxID=1871086 RepID=UPI00391BB763
MAKVALDLTKMDALADEAAERGLRAALGEAEFILKDDMLNRPGTGELYGNHRASAPGEPPAPDTNTLRANTNADTVIRRDGEDHVGSVVANTAYAKALELGTERMAARPYLSKLRGEKAAQLWLAFKNGAKSA